MPKPSTCPKCAAPLDVAAGAVTARCAYCGSILSITGTLHGATHRKKGGALAWIVVGVGLVVSLGALLIGGGLAAFLASRETRPAPPPTPTPPAMPARPAIPAPPRSAAPAPGFAAPALEFGSEGIGAGQFKDARSVAVDGEGRIYVGEYSGGRVQVFDSQGRFLTQWMADTKAVLLNLASDRKGTVYAVHPSRIVRYEGPTGKHLGEVERFRGARHQSYSDAFVALDGSLYAIAGGSNIVRITPEGEIAGTIDVAKRVGENITLDKVAVDGTGHVYAIQEWEKFVLKFAPDGRFVTRFGGDGRETGQLTWPYSVAVDGQGRVYVADLGRGIQVFDANGRFLDAFGNGVVMGLTIDERDEIFASLRNDHKIVKYARTAK